ncbi:hypothetical protein HZS_4563 [Henneguya salminicola]|nr:hypothetical protein HZS_4563 [Henneguya salminicola]
MAMAQGVYNYEYIFKFIIIGDMGVGKSCILHQFTEKKCKYSIQILLIRLVSNSERQWSMLKKKKLNFKSGILLDKNGLG